MKNRIRYTRPGLGETIARLIQERAIRRREKAFERMWHKAFTTDENSLVYLRA